MNRFLSCATLGVCAALLAGAMPARGAPGPTPPGPTPPVCYPSVITPSSGMLDQGFGCRGITTTAALESTPALPVSFLAKDLAIQSSDAIVVVGERRRVPNDGDTLVLRYTPGGTLDTTFGSAGIKVIDVSGTAIGSDGATAVLLQSDQKIVVVGGITDETFEGSRGYILRLLPNGDVDTTFGSDGRGWSLFDGIDKAMDVVPDGAGGFIVTGKTCRASCSARLARVAANGSIVAVLGPKTAPSFRLPGGDGQIARAARFASGRLAVVGMVNMPTTSTGDLGAMRFTLGSGGVATPDPAFGLGIGLTRSLGAAGQVADVILPTSGVMLVGATESVVGTPGATRFVLVSVSSDGRRATSMPAMFPGTRWGQLEALAQSGPRTYAAGFVYNAASQYQVAVAAYAYGALDPAFSGDGMATYLLGTQTRGHAIGVQSTGRIVVAGTTVDSHASSIRLVGILP